MKEKYLPPSLRKSAFNCPHCEAYAKQTWYTLGLSILTLTGNYYLRETLSNFSISQCEHCGRITIWDMDKLIYPLIPSSPLPSEDMPEDIKEDYLEARKIFSFSPRGACAILRLAIQKLMRYLGEKGENLNEDIANLVKKGLPIRIQKALDIVRVIGNNAVHPGQIDINDNPEIAIKLFEIINLIIDTMITGPKKIDELFNTLPETSKEQIKRRDKKINSEAGGGRGECP